MLSTGQTLRARGRGLRTVSQILLAIQILSFGHLLTVRHLTCLEHGDIIHVEQSAAKLEVGTHASRQPSLAAAESSVGADHEHCLVCVDANRRSLLAVPEKAFAHHGFGVSVAHAATTTFFTPVDLILLSPKNSPPSA
jgi:hypothetical protein